MKADQEITVNHVKTTRIGLVENVLYSFLATMKDEVKNKTKRDQIEVLMWMLDFPHGDEMKDSGGVSQ